MMNVLEKIVSDKRIEVELRKEQTPVSKLVQSSYMDKDCISLSQNLKDSKSGVIAEFKRKSPSKSILNTISFPAEVAVGYEKAGACGMSVLTDFPYFGGSIDDLIEARNHTVLPILRKEFIIDEYQIIESKSIGADCILLIASVLSCAEVERFSIFAKSLGLEVLLEVHSLTELNANLFESIDMIGVNNRNLKTLKVNTELSKRLSGRIPSQYVKVSESGISDVATVKELRRFGYEGFLIGEYFMKSRYPEFIAKEFIHKIIK